MTVKELKNILETINEDTYVEMVVCKEDNIKDCSYAIDEIIFVQQISLSSEDVINSKLVLIPT